MEEMKANVNPKKRSLKIADRKTTNTNKRRKLTHEELYDESAEFRIALELQNVLEQYIRGRKSCLNSMLITIWEDRYEESIDIILKLMHRLGYEPDGEEDEFDDPHRIMTFVPLKTLDY